MNDPADDPATPALAAQTLAAQTLVSVLVNVFQPLPCDFCPSAGPAYRDPERAASTACPA